MSFTVAGGEAIVYVRVSTDEQARSGLGIDAQTSACLAYCQARGHKVLQVVKDEGVSGRDEPERRVGLRQVLDYSRAHPEVRVVVYSLSRLSRRQSHIWRLLDEKGPHKLRLESASEPFDTTSPMGRAMLGMLGVWAQLEADMCSERTRAALKAKKSRGERLGPKEMIELEPELIASIVDMRKDGYSTARIAYELNKQGVPGVRGGRWHDMTVRRALKQWAKQKEDDGRKWAGANGRAADGVGTGAGGHSVESSGEAGSGEALEGESGDSLPEEQDAEESRLDAGRDASTDAGGAISIDHMFPGSWDDELHSK